MRKSPVALLLFIFLLLGCDKEKDPEPVGKVFDFSFRHDPFTKAIKEFELVVSQNDGKVLLDTLLATGIDHALKVRSNDAKLDYTMLYHNAAADLYDIYTYVQENRDKWHINFVSPYPKIDKTEPATIFYYNSPYNQLGLFRASHFRGPRSSVSDDYLTVIHYDRLLPTDLVYMLSPSLGKYLFTEITSAETHIDFSKASTTGIRKYNKPSGITYFSSKLYGFTKAGDFRTLMPLYFGSDAPADYDLHFPTTDIEDFELIITYTDAGNYHHTYTHKGATIPTAMDFAAASDFAVTKTEADDFQIQFGNDKPDSYETVWEADHANFEARWQIYASPEETALKPKTLLENLQTKTLAGKDLSLIKLQMVQSQKALKSSESGARQSRSIVKSFQ